MPTWMDVTIEVPDPLTYVDTDYDCAELTLVWRSPAGGEARLIFAVVEMLPPSAEREPGDRLRPAPALRLPGCGDEVHCGRAHLSPVAAIEWYRACLSGRVDLPEDLRTLSAASVLTTGTLADEPAWPVLPFEQQAFWEHSALWGERPGGVRRHQLVQLADDVLSLWSEDDRARASAWLSTLLPIDPLARAFLEGSVHLILPNALFAVARTRLGNDNDHDMFFDLVPHPGRSIVGLEVYLRESRPLGPALMKRFTLDDARARVRFPHRANEIDFAICCPRRGLLYESPTAGYLAQIFGTGRLAGRQRKVTVPSTKRRKEETFEVPVAEHEFPIHVGKPLEASISKVTTVYAENEAKSQARRFEQYWFDEEVDKATELIRSLIGQANESILMVDPYFGARELIRFALAATRSSLTVRILSAADFLSKIPVDADAAATKCDACGRPVPPAGRTQGEILEQQLVGILAQDRTLSIEVRVAKGSTAPIHDRFLCLDSTIRALGSSLNEFGSRGTMMLKVPAPDEIRPHLETAWNDGEPLSDFNKRRQDSTPDGGDASGGGE